ncbi:MAG: hypothetical protein ACHQ6U_05780 [Thermodesulfobacteriota bacterium]
MKNEILVNIPIPAGERISVRIIEAAVLEGSLYIVVEDSRYRVASGEFPAEATEDNITAKLLKATIGNIKRVNPDVLIGKQIDVGVVHKRLSCIGNAAIGIPAVIDDVIYCETYEEYEEKYIKSVKSSEK